MVGLFGVLRQLTKIPTPETLHVHEVCLLVCVPLRLPKNDSYFTSKWSLNMALGDDSLGQRTSSG
jgi:hypothetical protein